MSHANSPPSTTNSHKNKEKKSKLSSPKNNSKPKQKHTLPQKTSASSYTLFCQDCLDFLASQPDNSADLILTDPPYFIGFDDGIGWDHQWKHEDEYLYWCQKWTKECVRILKPSRLLIVWGTLKTDTFIRYKLNTSRDHNHVLFSQNEIVWSYNWGGRSRGNFARKHEYAFVWSKGKSFLFNPDNILIPRKLEKNIRTGLPYKKGTIPTCVWEKNNHTSSRDHINWHPTTKNITLTERLIKAYTHPGDTILDCFLGSGTTVVAAIRTGRKTIGTENNETYFQKMQERIQKETSQS